MHTVQSQTKCVSLSFLAITGETNQTATLSAAAQRKYDSRVIQRRTRASCRCDDSTLSNGRCQCRRTRLLRAYSCLFVPLKAAILPAHNGPYVHTRTTHVARRRLLIVFSRGASVSPSSCATLALHLESTRDHSLLADWPPVLPQDSPRRREGDAEPALRQAAAAAKK